MTKRTVDVARAVKEGPIDRTAYGDLTDELDVTAAWRGGEAWRIWSAALSNQQVGNQRQFTDAQNMVITDAATFRPVEICRLQLPAEWSRSWVLSWTVDALPVASSGFYAANASRSYVVLSWGAGGFQHRARVDAGRGGQVVLYGSYVSLAVQAFGIAVGQVVTVGASVAPGQGPSRQLYCSEYYGDIAGSSSVTRPIPPFATDLMHVFDEGAGGASAASTRLLQFLGAGGAGLGWYAFLNSSSNTIPNFGPFLPVPGEAQSLIYNNTVVATAQNDVTVIYRLSI